jgi:hypothetical protein
MVKAALPQPIVLSESMWSLTLPCAGRIIGAENFRSSTRKDLFNSIGQSRHFDHAPTTAGLAR